MQDKSIPLDTKGLLFFLLSLPSNWDIHIWWLKKELSLGDEKIQRMLKELKEASYIVRKRLNTAGGRFSWVMEVYPEPQRTMAGLADNGSSNDGSATDGKPHDKDNTEALDIKDINNTQQFRSDNNAETIGCSGHLIFDKAINPDLHAKLATSLKDIEPNLAQQMLDTLAAMGMQVKYPLKLIKSFLANQAEFDPTPSYKITLARLKVQQVESANRLANETRKIDPDAAAQGQAIIDRVRKKRQS